MNRRWQRYTDSERDAMAIMWAEGKGVKEIARVLGRTVAGIAGYTRDHRDQFPYRDTPVTKEEHEQILRLRESGKTYPQIAAYMGVCRETARRHVNREGRA